MFAKALPLAILLGLSAFSVSAMSAKEKDCFHQAQVVAAIQQARIDRVRAGKVQSHVEAQADWPARYNNAIPQLANWLYDNKLVTRASLKTENYGEAWRQACLAQ